MGSSTSMLSTDLAGILPRAAELVTVDGDTVPKFDAHVPRSEGLCAVTIAPPLDKHGRGIYVSSVCGPMASKKSFHSRVYHWDQDGISVIIAVRVSYALNAVQEWKESAPNAEAQDTAARAALADFEEISLAERCKTDRFAPDGATVWCYLTHSKAQLEALFRRGSGVCIVSPRACPAFLRAVRDMGPHAMVDNLYVEEVKALSQMLFTKVLPDTTAIDALSTLAMERSRRVFGFCADFLLDQAPTCIMQHLVRDRPHLVFDIQAARTHMRRDVALYYGCGLADAEAAVRGKPAYRLIHSTTACSRAAFATATSTFGFMSTTRRSALGCSHAPSSWESAPCSSLALAMTTTSRDISQTLIASARMRRSSSRPLQSPWA